MNLEVLFQDMYLIAVNKPTGMFVHKTRLDPTATEFALQTVRDMIGQHVYPVHRLDRKTSGLLLFAKDRDTQILMNEKFTKHQINKFYHAIVRGYINDAGTIDYELMLDNGKVVDALTHYQCLNRVEVPIKSYSQFDTSRYSLVRLHPITGRQHQLRRHLAHIFHPIIGDRPHGCNKQNRAFLHFYNMNEMMLHNSKMVFEHPYLKTQVTISAPIFGEFLRMVNTLGFNCDLINYYEAK